MSENISGQFEQSLSTNFSDYLSDSYCIATSEYIIL